jgi:squalene synthase HpnC
MPVDHYENFPVASVLVPRPLRPAVAAIYWFARSADDFADEGNVPPEERLARLDAYRAQLRHLGEARAEADPIFLPLREAVVAHHLPLQPFHDLLDAFSQDVLKGRYADFDEVLDYCRRSANPVGVLMLHLVGAATPQNLRWSDAICSGLQLANFWQDVAVDWRKNRVYLPQDSMARFGVREAQIAEARADAAWESLLSHEVSRARAMLLSGAPLARAVGGRFGFELRLVVQGGLRILEQIDRVRGDVFRHRPMLRGPDWLRMLWRAATRYPR